MRRSTRLGFALAVLLLVAGVGGYSAFWFIAAGRIADGVAQWAQAMRAQQLDLSWRSIAVGGYPFAFRVTLGRPRLSGPVGGRTAVVTAPEIAAATAPWRLRQWRVAAPHGLTASAGPAEQHAATLDAGTALGSVAFNADGAVRIWFRATDPTASVAGLHLAAGNADLWLNLPPRAPQSHTEPAVGLALDVRQLTLPVVPPPLANPVAEVAFGVTMMGAIPAGTPRQAAEAWRADGGTLELEHFLLRWDTLTLRGSGTLALDADLQPIGGCSGSIEGYDELMAALVASGRIRKSDAGLARLALAMLAKAGPNGQPQIATSFTIQQGQMYLGPARLGPAPHIDWQ